MLRSILVCVLALSQITVDAAWYQFPYGNDNFNEDAEYGTNVTITCDDGRVPETATFDYWIRPDLSIMESGEKEEFWTLDGSAMWTVDNDGKLTATLLNERQFGFYYCVKKGQDDEKHVIKKAINYDGPFFGSRWSAYRKNLITGLVAAGVFLVLVVIFALLQSYCCKSEHSPPNITKETTSNGTSQPMTYVGAAEKKDVPGDDYQYVEDRL